MNTRFVRADSTNLPKMESIMIMTYMRESDKFNAAELRGVKALMSSRTSYLETAVGYVEVFRVRTICTVRAKVTPEHKIRDKAYTVAVEIDEQDEVIRDTSCDGCAAAAGGCKHSLVLLYWLEKKSNEPASTSVTCYWKKPRLLDARVEHVKSTDIFKKGKIIKMKPKTENLLEEFLSECKRHNVRNSLITCFTTENQSLNKYNLFDLMISYLESIPGGHETFNNFRSFIETSITIEIKSEILKKTIKQAESKLWHSMRQARITASQLYDAAHCKVDGSLVQQILGGYKVPETAAIKRGKKLESLVLKEIEKKLKKEIQQSGFILINGLIGASPDGICDECVVEIKCPMSQKTVKNYIENSVIKPKFKVQICCQMLAANKTKGVFCVADPKFELNKKVNIYWIDYDKCFTDELMRKAIQFWEKYIYPKLLHSART